MLNFEEKQYIIVLIIFSFNAVLPAHSKTRSVLS